MPLLTLKLLFVDSDTGPDRSALLTVILSVREK